MYSPFAMSVMWHTDARGQGVRQHRKDTSFVQNQRFVLKQYSKMSSVDGCSFNFFFSFQSIAELLEKKDINVRASGDVIGGS